MTPRKLVRLVVQSIRRNRRDFLLSSIGIVVGISTLLFFTALGAGIKDVVLEKIFVVRQLEVVKKTYEVGAFRSEGLFGGRELDADTVGRLERIEGVEQVYPKMKFTFPASVRGGKELLGKNMVAELIADGIPTELVAGEVDGELGFKDWGAEITCSADDACPDGHSCAEGVCQPRSCNPGADDEVCDGVSYCNESSRSCEMPIPVLANPKLLEIYNGSVHTALGGAQGMLSKLPKLSEEALIGFEGEAVLGASFLGRASSGKTRRVRMRLVGFSEKAIDLGATIPIGYVKRFNTQFGQEDSADEYHSIVVETRSNEDVARVAKKIEDMGLALSDDYEDAQRAGLLIMLLTVVFNLIALIILAISAVNIMHTFLMVILERRREIGLMRAVGATRWNIRGLILGEATVLGLFGGAVGVLLGILATWGIDRVFDTRVGDFPFKPDSLFLVEWWMVAASVGVAVFFCWIGAMLPAFQASHIDPAEALSGR